MNTSLTEQDLQLFVASVRKYFSVTTKREPDITSAYLGGPDVQTHDFNGIVSFSGSYEGHIIVSMPAPLLRELLLLQFETDLSDSNLLDAVGEIANTLAGNARKQLGSSLEISVPVKVQGKAGLTARIRSQPYVITLGWSNYPALVCVDVMRRG